MPDKEYLECLKFGAALLYRLPHLPMTLGLDLLVLGAGSACPQSH